MAVVGTIFGLVAAYCAGAVTAIMWVLYEDAHR